MNIEKKENYTLISPTEASLEEFTTSFVIEDFDKENLLLNFLDTFEVSTSQVDSFSEIFQTKKESGKSFIIIVSGIEIDDLKNESMSVVPTIREAEDTLEMDEIERDLGL